MLGVRKRDWNIPLHRFSLSLSLSLCLTPCFHPSLPSLPTRVSTSPLCCNVLLNSLCYYRNHRLLFIHLISCFICSASVYICVCVGVCVCVCVCVCLKFYCMFCRAPPRPAFDCVTLPFSIPTEFRENHLQLGICFVFLFE